MLSNHSVTLDSHFLSENLPITIIPSPFPPTLAFPIFDLDRSPGWEHNSPTVAYRESSPP